MIPWKPQITHSTASPPQITHSNGSCFSSGSVCLSLLLQEGHHPGAGHKGFWQATMTLSEVLTALQTYLDEPNPKSVANPEACSLYKKGAAEYNERVVEFARSYPALLEAAKKKKS